MKKGLYIQEDFWNAVEDLPKSAQDMYFGALIRLYFTGEAELPKHKEAKRCFILTQERVRIARQKSLAKYSQNSYQNDHQNSYQNDHQNSHQNDYQNDHQNGDQKDDSPKKSERESKSKNNIPTSREEVQSWADSISLPLDVDAFWDFYESKGWKVGKSPMKDWRAAARNAVRKGWAQKAGGEDDEYSTAF